MFFLDRQRGLQRWPFVEERDPRLRRFRMRYVLQMELERSFEARFHLEVWGFRIQGGKGSISAGSSTGATVSPRMMRAFCIRSMEAWCRLSMSSPNNKSTSRP